MKIKTLIILIILISLGGSGFFVYKNFFTPETEEKTSVIEEKKEIVVDKEKETANEGIPEEKEEEEKEKGKEESFEEQMTCQDYCRERGHEDCFGRWDISGEYPECICNYICEAKEINDESEEKESGALTEVILGPQTNWASFHGNSARTGFSSSKAPAEPKMLWQWTVEDFRNAGYSGDFDTNWLIIENNKVFVALEEIFVLDLKTGEKLWSFNEEVDNFYPRGLAVGGEMLFVTVNKGDNLRDLPPGFIYAFDKNTGKFLWKYQTQAGISHSLPLFAENKVFVGDDSGTIYALNAEGTLIWKKYLEDAEVIHSSPAFYEGTIFIGTEGTGRSNAMPSRLYALEVASGAELWRFEVDYIPGKLNLLHAAPAVLGNVVYIGSENGYFYAVSAKDGSLIWKKIVASGSEMIVGISGTAALGYEKVFVGTYEGKFLALNQNNGEIVWSYDFGGGNADSSPLLADEKVYFGTGEGSNGYFYCFNASNGNVIWKKKLGGSSPALASDVLVVQNAWLEENLSSETPILVAYSQQ